MKQILDPDDLETPRQQIGALVWRFDHGFLKILLVTSRDTGRFVIPKGWTEDKLTDPQAAAREAFEEAGVTGAIKSEPCGSYAYTKVMGPGFALPCVVDVYSMQASKILPKWPEKGERSRHWFDLDDAASKVAEPQLADLIRNFVPTL